MLSKKKNILVRTFLCIFAICLLMGNTAYAVSDGILTEKLKTALHQGKFLWAFGLSYIAGVFASLTACVYPLIPITVSIFGAKEPGIRKIRAVLLASVFVLGIAVMYVALGIMMSFLGRQFGSFLSSYALMLPVILIFLLMAVSLFGAFSLHLPSGIHKVLVQIGGKGVLGAFLMGLLAGIISSPCTGPVLVALLSVVVSQGSLIFGALLLFCYALGLGTLFFFVAIFSLVLPKSGRWMDAVKSLMAIMMILTAGYFLRNLSSSLRNYGEDKPLFFICHVTLLFMGVAIGGIHLRFQRDSMILLRKSVGVLLICVGGFGILSFVLTLPKLAWHTDENIIIAARQQHRPVLIDFSATWCLPCVQMETKTFADEEVKKELERFLLWKVDCSKQCIYLGRKYGIETLPGVVIIDGNGEIVNRIEDFIPAEKLLPLLTQVK